MNDIKTAFPCARGDGNDITAPYDAELGLKADMSLRERAERLEKAYRFCTPGHKGELFAADVTEIDEDVVFPGGAVQRAEKLIAKHYGAKKARISVGGSSMCIKAAIWAAGVDFICPSFSHRSVFEGAKLAGVKAITLGEGADENGLPEVPMPDMIARALEDNCGVGAVLVTSPDYFGRAADISEIKRVCDRFGKLLLVDAAHGAHFATRRDIFPSNGESTADFINLSAHKTLRALTQSAVGLCNNERYFERYDEAFTLLGTSSPSYMLLSSVEDAVKYEENNAVGYDDLVRECRKLRDEADCLENADPLRICVKTKDAGAAYRAAIKQGILPETYYGSYLVFIVTLSDSVDKIKKLARFVRNR